MMKNEMKLPRDLKRLEKRLEEHLQPVKPPAAFVSNLRSRLDQEMHKKLRSRKVKSGLLIVGGVVGAAALIITLIRSLTSWEKIGESLSRLMPKFRKREQAASI